LTSPRMYRMTRLAMRHGGAASSRSGTPIRAAR
jgi:hypothetical protein